MSKKVNKFTYIYRKDMLHQIAIAIFHLNRNHYTKLHNTK